MHMSPLLCYHYHTTIIAVSKRQNNRRSPHRQ
uniref:Uncharacterized protein n=1 Tax=Arundo donax TaxID=35708 RepID=A0A0A9GUV0_ARUDO